MLGIAPASPPSWDLCPRLHIRFGVGGTLNSKSPRQLSTQTPIPVEQNTYGIFKRRTAGLFLLGCLFIEGLYYIIIAPTTAQGHLGAFCWEVLHYCKQSVQEVKHYMDVA